ncbi:LLM class flavin-dependent oxidoreductase [Gulosibacter molinativorax]|uniref:LLM class flavin-dependent oxidoreductase n=1 Tax=Gulosibacter molinativorax TaxID=256821 RepID=A0ABT7CAZ6_9MICO|nr:LLM class flavin-dependent oxidoreductase [Gulosibacter molinativorax]MDJ1371984.1 LLM class flavin-dependent oxidoreductase [Gulosibacter molinativorax]QUY62652.1 Alkanal monooxygenase alpha chain [Gulosibacter molinativorax]
MSAQGESDQTTTNFPSTAPEDLILGIDTFGDLAVGSDGKPITHAQTIRNVLEQAQLADRVGIDVIGIGEHHRDDYAVSSPETVLAAIAATTERIKLGTAVTVLSSDDPVRVFERFSTVDALSNGRAEIIVGRGSFTESFPLFGLSLADYEVLFEEKLDLWSHVAKDEPVTWRGTTRAALTDQPIYPPLETPEGEGKRTFPTWVAVGGSPQSVVRTAKYDFPLMLAIIGGSAERFAPFARVYREAQAHYGHTEAHVGYHSPGHVADTDEEAREQLYPYFKIGRDRVGRDRGWPAMGRGEYEQEANHGALLVGSPETVARKIVTGMKALGAERFDLKYSNGPMPHELLMHSLELYGTKVIPLVREMMAE